MSDESIQPVILITGTPGGGKSLYAVSNYLKGKAGAFSAGLKGSVFPTVDAERWFDTPSGSVVVVDEAWKWFSPRSHLKEPPEHFQRVPEIRHSGHTLVLVTQDPADLDARIRRRVGKHYHLVRVFGTERSNVHEWNEVQEDVKNRADTEHAIWEFDKSCYPLYKSAEVHKIKTEVPRRIKRIPIYLALAVLFVGFGGYFVYKSLLAPAQKIEAEVKKSFGAAAGKAAPSRAAGGAIGGASSDRPLDPVAYLESFNPRVPGLPHTAPRYDKVTQVAEAPFPAACISSGPRCQCYSQQATRLEVPLELCRSIALGGYFVDWRGPAQQGMPSGQPSVAAPSRPPAPEPYFREALPPYGATPLGKQNASIG